MDEWLEKKVDFNDFVCDQVVTGSTHNQNKFDFKTDFSYTNPFWIILKVK